MLKRFTVFIAMILIVIMILPGSISASPIKVDFGSIESIIKTYNIDLQIINNNVSILDENRVIVVRRIDEVNNQLITLDENIQRLKDGEVEIQRQIDNLKEQRDNLDVNEGNYDAEYQNLTNQINFLNNAHDLLKQQRTALEEQRNNIASQLPNELIKLDSASSKARLQQEMAQLKMINQGKTLYTNIQRLMVQRDMDKTMAEIRERDLRRNRIRWNLGLISNTQWQAIQEEHKRAVNRSQNLENQLNTLLMTFKLFLGVPQGTDIIINKEIPQANYENIQLAEAVKKIDFGLQLRIAYLDFSESKRKLDEARDNYGTNSPEYRIASLEYTNHALSVQRIRNSAQLKILDNFEGVIAKRNSVNLEKEFLENEKRQVNNRELLYSIGMISFEELDRSKMSLVQKEMSYINMQLELIEAIEKFYLLSLGIE
jgi:peptidoglycan hydrolase CwlO-like protein